MKVRYFRAFTLIEIHTNQPNFNPAGDGSCGGERAEP